MPNAGCPTAPGRPNISVVFRRPRPVDPLASVQPATLPRRWAAPIDDVLAARGRFVRLVETTAAGPLRDQLDALAVEVDRAVLAAWDSARRGAELEHTLGGLDVAAAAARLKEARRDLSRSHERGDSDAVIAERHRAVEVAAERFATLNRLANELDDLDERLGSIAEDLDATVAIAAELTLGTTAGVDPATTLGAVAARLSALRAALGEVFGEVD